MLISLLLEDGVDDGAGVVVDQEEVAIAEAARDAGQRRVIFGVNAVIGGRLSEGASKLAIASISMRSALRAIAWFDQVANCVSICCALERRTPVS